MFNTIQSSWQGRLRLPLISIKAAFIGCHFWNHLKFPPLKKTWAWRLWEKKPLPLILTSRSVRFQWHSTTRKVIILLNLHIILCMHYMIMDMTYRKPISHPKKSFIVWPRISFDLHLERGHSTNDRKLHRHMTKASPRWFTKQL